MTPRNGGPGADPRDPRRAGNAGDRDELRTDRDVSVIRHEERMVVHREQRETGRLRLRKYVVEEPVRQDVPLGSETAGVVRTPVTEEERQAFLEGRELPVGEDEMILYRTEPVVRTVRVPYQRVRLVVERTEHTEAVEETLRKERVDVDTDRGTGGDAGTR